MSETFFLKGHEKPVLEAVLKKLPDAVEAFFKENLLSYKKN